MDKWMNGQMGGRASRIQWPETHGQLFLDSGYQIITKLQFNLQKGQSIFKFVQTILEPLWLDG